MIAGLLDEIAADSKIDETHLDSELLNIPYIQAKWMKRYINLNKVCRRLAADLAHMKILRTNYYMGRAGEDVYKEFPINRIVLKGELEEVLAADKEMVDAQELHAEIKDMVSAIEKFITSLNNRGYNIGKAIDYLKWSRGG